MDLSLTDYIRHALDKLQYILKIYPQYSLLHYINANWTEKGERPYAKEEDTPQLLHPKDIKYTQQVVETFLHYTLSLDCAILTTLNDIGLKKSLRTKKVKETVQQLLDYANTYQNMYLRYYSSDMQLNVDTDASFLVLPKARSRIAVYF